MGDTLKDQIDRIEEKLGSMETIISEGKVKTPKEFKLPFSAKMTRGKRKKNHVVVLKINENKGVTFKTMPIKEQTINIDGVPRLATGEYVLDYNGTPLIIAPSWSVEPFSPTKSYTDTIEKGTNTVGYNVLLAAMKSNMMQGKKEFGMWLIIGAVVLVGVAAYMYFYG